MDQRMWETAAIKERSRVIVFVDGSNLYHRLDDIGWPTRVDIGFLAAKVVGGRDLRHIYYYNALPPDGRPHTKSGRHYIEQVKGTPGLTFRPTRLQVTEKPDENGGRFSSFVEKGGDTALATDVVVAAAKDEFDTGIIVSSDGDYEPAVRTVREQFSKEFEVVFFPGRRPFVMEGCALMRKMRRSYIQELSSNTKTRHQPEPVRLGRSKWYLSDE